MIRTKTIKSNPCAVILAPDKKSGAFIKRKFTDKNIESLTIIFKGAKWEKDVLATLTGSPNKALVICPSLKFAVGLISLVKKLSIIGRRVFVWSDKDISKPHAVDDNALLLHILRQYNCHLFINIDMLSDSVGIFLTFGEIKDNLIKINNQSNSILKRILQSRFINRDTKKIKGSSLKSKPDELIIDVTKNGQIVLTDKISRYKANGPDCIKMAIDTLCQTSFDFKIKRKKPDTKIIAAIAKGPRRLLSEHTSGRLAKAFGIELTKRKLCHSVTQATHFAQKTGFPVVLKLNLPNPDKKRKTSICDLGSVSEVYKAYTKLETLKKELSSAMDFGVLVLKTNKQKAWVDVKLLLHPTFGKILIAVFDGNNTDKNSLSVACKIPFKPEQVFAQIMQVTNIQNEKTAKKYALALFQTGSIVDYLKERIFYLDALSFVNLDDEHLICRDIIMGIGEENY